MKEVRVLEIKESDILYKNGLTYEQGKEEMVQIIMKGIRET